MRVESRQPRPSPRHAASRGLTSRHTLRGPSCPSWTIPTPPRLLSIHTPLNSLLPIPFVVSLSKWPGQSLRRSLAPPGATRAGRPLRVLLQSTLAPLNALSDSLLFIFSSLTSHSSSLTPSSCPRPLLRTGRFLTGLFRAPNRQIAPKPPTQTNASQPSPPLSPLTPLSSLLPPTPVLLHQIGHILRANALRPGPRLSVLEQLAPLALVDVARLRFVDEPASGPFLPPHHLVHPLRSHEPSAIQSLSRGRQPHASFTSAARPAAASFAGSPGPLQYRRTPTPSRPATARRRPRQRSPFLPRTHP